jgi:hypothetical protein
MKRPQRSLELIAGTIAASLWAYGAHAMGEITQRQVDSTTLHKVAPCSGGKIVEQLFEGGRADFGWSGYVLACLIADDKARWVFVSGLTMTMVDSCERAEEYVIQHRRHCFSAEGAQDVPGFEVTPQSEKDNGPPFKLAFEILRYGLGRECTLLHQPVTKVEAADRTTTTYTLDQWQCDQLELFDGVTNGPPKEWQTMHLETVSTQPLSREFAKGLVDRFMIDSSDTGFNYLQEYAKDVE